jgi:hypothetical protein
MKNAIFWDIEIQFIPHRRNIMSLLQGTADKAMEDLRVSWQ